MKEIHLRSNLFESAQRNRPQCGASCFSIMASQPPSPMTPSTPRTPLRSAQKFAKSSNHPHLMADQKFPLNSICSSSFDGRSKDPLNSICSSFSLSLSFLKSAGLILLWEKSLGGSRPGVSQNLTKGSETFL